MAGLFFFNNELIELPVCRKGSSSAKPVHRPLPKPSTTRDHKMVIASRSNQHVDETFKKPHSKDTATVTHKVSKQMVQVRPLFA